MSTEGIFQIASILAAFLCSLVAGFLLAFALVVMPGIRSLNDREFIRAFQRMDLNQDNLGEPGIYPVNNSTIPTLKKCASG